MAAQAIEAAKRLPPMPPFVDYSALLEDLRRWIEELQGANADVEQAQQVGTALAARAGQAARLREVHGQRVRGLGGPAAVRMAACVPGCACQ